jgi:hypothetical protein
MRQESSANDRAFGLQTAPSIHQMKNQRQYPRYDIKVATRAEAGYAAFLIDHDTGESWFFDVDLTWKKIRKASASTKAPTIRRKR